MAEREYEVWVVDRIEGRVAILVEEEGEIVAEVAVDVLSDEAEEGAVLRVPLGEASEPVWTEARRDDDAEAQLRQEGEARLERLRERDPGGDVAL